MKQNTANYNLSVDTDNDYNMKLGEAVNVIISQGGNIYYDTTEHWNAIPDLIAKRGAIYVYNDKTVIRDDIGNVKFVPGLKIGDGTSYLIDMAFVGDEEIFALSEHIADPVAHVTTEEREFWNNKITGFLSPDDSETLVLSKF